MNSKEKVIGFIIYVSYKAYKITINQRKEESNATMNELKSIKKIYGTNCY